MLIDFHMYLWSFGDSEKTHVGPLEGRFEAETQFSPHRDQSKKNDVNTANFDPRFDFKATDKTTFIKIKRGKTMLRAVQPKRRTDPSAIGWVHYFEACDKLH